MEYIERPELPIYGNVGTLRNFNPLSYPIIGKCDCIFSLGMFLEQGTRREPDGSKKITTNNRDFENLKTEIINFDQINHSKDPLFRMELIISVCGLLQDTEIIQYLESLDNSYICNNKVHITVCQRPNIGWLWGTLEYVWDKYKIVDCDYWMANEVDNLFLSDEWFDRFKNRLDESDKNVGFLGKYERPNGINPYEYYGPLNKLTWKDGNNNDLENPTEEDTKHVCPGYFFKKSFLEKMDKTFGYFTLALTFNYELDAIVYGEVGFCQRTKAMNYNWLEYQDLI